MFLEGPAGAGKTTLGVARLQHLLESGVPGQQILILTPQRTLAEPYRAALRDPSLPAGGQVGLATVGGLARRLVALFWPVIAEAAGFTDPAQPPLFLTLETAQYYMDTVLSPFLEEGYFDGVTIRRNRLASQILDNLNKAAVVGFPLDEIAERLRAAWPEESAALYQQVQACAVAFRGYCLAHNLLDFSLQIEIFFQHVLPLSRGRDYLFAGYRHLIADNVEEDVPVAHDLLLAWLEACDSGLIIYDWDGGYRAFLGADPDSAYRLKEASYQHVRLPRNRVASDELRTLGAELADDVALHTARPTALTVIPEVLRYDANRFHPDMLDSVVAQVSELVLSRGVPPNEIAILAPYLGEALRFSLTQKLDRYGIATITHRPSRALREEPGTRCLLTLTAVAHPHWEVVPSAFDVTQMLVQAIEGMDWVRAQQMSRIVYRPTDEQPRLTSFDQIEPEMQERISYTLGGRYSDLWQWIESYQKREAGPLPLDHFMMEIFEDLLSQAGFGFHRDLDAAQTAANLVESVRKFRRAFRAAADVNHVGQEYLRMVEQGVVAAQYLGQWQLAARESLDAVWLLPAYTFLMRNQPVEYQFWLEVGSVGWWERPYQPLTHPHVLTRGWPKGQAWTDEDEYRVRQETMARLLLGLVRRCRRGVYLGISDLGEGGYEQRGPLLERLQQVLRRVSRAKEVTGAV
jgi:hypothetical protein